MGDYYETSYVKPGRDGRKPRLCVTYHDGHGKRRERTRAAEPKRMSALRREAEEWRAKLNREREEEARRREEEERRAAEEAAAAKIPLLRDYVVRYIKGRLIEGIEKSTALNYGNYARLVRDPAGGIAGTRLDLLTPDECREWLGHLLDDCGLNPTYVSQALVFLKQAMKQAVVDRVIDFNPIAGVRGPKVRRPVPNALDRPSVSRLRDWIAEGGDWFRTAVAISLFTGMRRGEVCGLQWRDVDFQRGVIHVRHAIGKGKGGNYLKSPKNGKERRFDIPDDLFGALRRRLEEVGAELMGLYEPEDAGRRVYDLFVCGNVRGTWREPTAIDRRWKGLREELGLRGLQRDRCPFHDLRHTFITYMVLGGVPVTSIMPVVGHSSASMTLDVYASIDPEATREAMGRVGDLLPRDEAEPDEPSYLLPSPAQ